MNSIAGLVGIAIVAVRCGGCCAGVRRGEGEHKWERVLGGDRRGEGGCLGGGVGSGFPVYGGVVEDGVYSGRGSKDALTRSEPGPVGEPVSIGA
jgi:hypothetical protein